MKFKPALWRPIAIIASGINLVSVGFAAAVAEPWHAGIHAGLALGFGLWAQRLRARAGSSEGDASKEQLEQQAVALDDIRTTLSNQSAELAELQERVDFTERLLAQVRDRPPLGHREERG